MEQMYKLQLCLLLTNCNCVKSNLLQDGTDDIIKIFGGIEEVTKQLIRQCVTKETLIDLQKLLKKLQQNDSIENNRNELSNPKNNKEKATFFTCELNLISTPPPIFHRICNYLTNSDLKQFRLVSMQCAIISMSELMKLKIYIFNASSLITSQSDKIRMQFDKLLHGTMQRMDANATYENFMNMIQNNYQIPVNQQIIYSYLNKCQNNYYSREFNSKLIKRNINNDSRSLFHEENIFRKQHVPYNYNRSRRRNHPPAKQNINFVVFDKRKIGFIQHGPSELNHIVILKYFNILTQKINVIDIIIANKMSTHKHLSHYIQNTLIHKCQEQMWCKKLGQYVQSQKINTPILFFQQFEDKQEYSDKIKFRIKKINSENSIEFTHNPSIIIFQMNSLCLNNFESQTNHYLNCKNYIYDIIFPPLEISISLTERATQLLSCPTNSIYHTEKLKNVKRYYSVTKICEILAEKLKIKQKLIVLKRDKSAGIYSVESKQKEHELLKRCNNNTIGDINACKLKCEIIEEYDVIKMEQFLCSSANNYALYNVYLIPPERSEKYRNSMYTSKMINLKILWIILLI